METTSFWPLCKQMVSGRLINLTHPFNALISLTKLGGNQNDLWNPELFLNGEWGTYIEAPALLWKEGRSIEQIGLQEMFLPLVVIDIHEKVEKNPDYILLVDDVLSWEDQYGEIPKGAFVALRTDWSKRWPGQKALSNQDQNKISHTPGWSLDALSYLFQDCQITATGQETLSPDAGFSMGGNEMCRKFISSKNRFQISLLTNLDQCSPKGGMVICSFPLAKDLGIFPARVIAICPA